MAGEHAFDPAEERLGKVVDARLARRLWPYIRPQRRLIALGLGLLLLTAGAGLGLVWLVKVAIDEHVAPGRFEGFGWLVAGFALLAAVELTGKALQAWTIEKAGQNALLQLRLDLFQHLQRLSSSFYDKTPIGRLIGRVTTDVEALQETFSSGVVTILGDLVFLATTAAILFVLNWRLAAAVLLVVPVLLALTLWIRIKVRKAYAAMVAARSRLNAYLHEHVRGMPVVQMFVRERIAREGFQQIDARMRDAQLGSVTWESLHSALTEMIGSLTLALILWYGGGIAAGSLGLELPRSGVGSVLTLGTLFAFIDSMQRFFVPLNDLSLKYTVMQNAMTAAERIFALLDVDQVTPEPAEPARVPPARGAIAFRDVVFGYDPQEPVLQGLSFRIAPGERVAVVGATGAGKTTLLKLLVRLYDVQSGSIELDGLDLRRYALADLRRRIGVVPQDVFLFGGDVLDNVRMGRPGMSDDEAQRAADRLHLDQVVARFPRGYAEPVRERGANLSSGERQLVAFARVLAAAPPVLALDEATSNVDTRTEHLLQEAVHELMEGRTSLVIAHRLSTIRDVDRILVLHQGRLVEEGSHEELLHQHGIYWKLHRLQLQPEEAVDSSARGGGEERAD